MFEQLRNSLNELLDRATRPEDRRLVLARMKGTLVQAQLGVDDVRSALQQTRRKLEAEQRELETVRRRRELAVGIKDQETVTIADRFERQHQEKIALLEEKLAVQSREVEMAERELETMKAEFRAAVSGGPTVTPGAAASDPLEDPLGDPEAESRQVREEIDALARQRARDERDADAARRLEELKRKMGK
ncbi:MAG TPA: hypothetical protein VJ867_17595 [Gemmatimonadaceae bacterium]|nr:hypothetical protein [Gemmatimonadaceae bacterium]